MNVVTTKTLPALWDGYSVYHLIPIEKDLTWYRLRTDRNHGYIKKDPEQDIIASASIAIAGCGGMGGHQADIFIRLGIGTLKIADPEYFDVSNINRQRGATIQTVGTQKALETARLLREVADDTHLWVYPHGINKETVDHFLEGVDICIDMIEFWAIGARLLLHEACAKRNIPIINCNSVGHRTYILLFTHCGISLQEAMGIGQEEGYVLEEKIKNKKATNQDIQKVMHAILSIFVPEAPEYGDGSFSTKHMLYERLLLEQKAPIIATNPPFAAGVSATETLLLLLKQKSPIHRSVQIPIPFPGYMMIDVAQMRTQCFEGVYWK